jgi:anaerobic selenocysteine-containing dehydrogenase
VNVDKLRRSVPGPECIIHPDDAARRGIQTGDTVEVRNDRGAFTVTARVDDGIRPGVVWAPSIWWLKYSADGQNANATTSQRETDLGGGATFYDNQVEVTLAND